MFIIFNCPSALKQCNEQQRNHKNPWIMNLRVNISRISLFQRVRECAVLLACLKIMLNKQKIKNNCDWTNQRIRNFEFIPFIKILRIVSHFWSNSSIELNEKKESEFGDHYQASYLKLYVSGAWDSDVCCFLFAYDEEQSQIQ